MQFSNVRQNENSFKISLKSPNSMKMAQNGQMVAANVTSTNPKTPSPSTNDVSEAFIIFNIADCIYEILFYRMLKILLILLTKRVKNL